MARFLMLVYEEEVDQATQHARERELPLMVELHRSLREAGLLVDVQRLQTTDRAASVRVRDGAPLVTDGPFALTKEALAGYYVLECADRDTAVACAQRLPMARWGTIEVRPVVTPDEWLTLATAAGAAVTGDAVADLQ